MTQNVKDLLLFELISLREKIDKEIGDRVSEEKGEVEIVYTEGTEHNDFYDVEFFVYQFNGGEKRLSNNNLVSKTVLVDGRQSKWITYVLKVKDGTVLKIYQNGCNKWGNMINALLDTEKERYFIVDKNAPVIQIKGFGKSSLEGNVKELYLSKAEILKIISQKEEIESRWKSKTL